MLDEVRASSPDGRRCIAWIQCMRCCTTGGGLVCTGRFAGKGHCMSTGSEYKTRPQQAWAHKEGKIDLRPLAPAQWGPEALAARAQIADAFFRFGMAWDEARLDVLCSCFTQDAIFESAE